MRHFIPTFDMLPERRFARPTDAYDVMRVRDSWLCAQLADAIICRNASFVGFDQSRKSWQKTFDLLMAKLGSDSWAACCQKYLS